LNLEWVRRSNSARGPVRAGDRVREPEEAPQRYLSVRADPTRAALTLNSAVEPEQLMNAL
jgi:hypothetical protein